MKAHAIVALFSVSALFSGCMLDDSKDVAEGPEGVTQQAPTRAEVGDGLTRATFAGGCFWCMEPPFDELDGVISTTSGYTGGKLKNPSYAEVTAGDTGHAEAVEIVFDPEKIGYAELLEVFWRNIDPTTPDKQFCDTGNQYRTAIFYHDDGQKRLAEASRQALEQSSHLPGSIVTEIVPASEFYPAESYHQDYYRKNRLRYTLYRYACGRDDRLEELWGGDRLDSPGRGPEAISVDKTGV